MHIMSLVRGVAIGFILGVLFAPDNGPATRRKLSTAAGDIKDDMEDTFGEIGSTVSNAAEKIKDKASRMMHKTAQEVNGLEHETAF